MEAHSVVFLTSFILNILLILAMIFIERKKPQTIISWTVILTFLPIVGFILYILVGGGLSYKTKKLLKQKMLLDEDYINFVQKQEKTLKNINFFNLNANSVCKDTILFNLNNSHSAVFNNCNVRVFTNGEDKLISLKKDLENASHSINMLYYIFANDNCGKEIMDILVRKAKQGIKVKLIYDSVGSLKTKHHFFNKLKKAGGSVCEFFPPLFGIRLINLKMNYRNHRKIVVIDGKVGYTGGINIRDDHMGKSKKLRPWRDTHIKVEGEGVYGLQNAFFNDWKFCSNDNTPLAKIEEEGYYPPVENKGNVSLQVVTSGPETLSEPIKEAMIRMIMSAKKSVYIQSPYFVPDDTFLTAIKIAKKSGVDVKIMIPKIADKKFVYAATLSYAKDLLKHGVDVFLYKGFIHSKVLIVDNEFATIGTCNTDNRSFSLNFEINTFLYDSEFGKLNGQYFENDLLSCTKLDYAFFKKRPFYTLVTQAIFRLFSPLL